MDTYKTPLLSVTQRAMARDLDVAWIQAWLNVNCGTNLEVDGVWGTSSRAEFIAAMTCRNAKAITAEEMQSLVRRLGDVNDKRIKLLPRLKVLVVVGLTAACQKSSTNATSSGSMFTTRSIA